MRKQEQRPHVLPIADAPELTWLTHPAFRWQTGAARISRRPPGLGVAGTLDGAAGNFVRTTPQARHERRDRIRSV